MPPPLHALFNRLRTVRGFAGISAFLLSTLLSLLILLASAPDVFCQGATSTVKGVVTDPQGSVLAGATVSISSEALAVKRRTTTDGEGNYTFAQLPPSVYMLKVEAPGFAAAEIANLALQVGQQATHN